MALAAVTQVIERITRLQHHAQQHLKRLYDGMALVVVLLQYPAGSTNGQVDQSQGPGDTDYHDAEVPTHELIPLLDESFGVTVAVFGKQVVVGCFVPKAQAHICLSNT